jgi:hypothetical protein
LFFSTVGFIGGEMAKIKELVKKYAGEWLAIEVTEEKDGEPVKGKLLLHKRDRSELWEKVSLSKKREIYVTFAGPPIKKGYAVAF